MGWTPPSEHGIEVPDWRVKTNQSLKKKESTMKLKRIGLDLAKNVFQLHGVDRQEQVVLRKKLKREQLLAFFAELERDCEIGMEACGGSHHWARQLQALGFVVKLMPPQFVKPYVKANKNDARDAEAICEAMSRPTMRFVRIKTVAEQSIQAVHRVRSACIGQRTACINQIRGLCSEYGLCAPLQRAALNRAIPQWLEEADNGLSYRFRQLLQTLQEDLEQIDARIAWLDEEIRAISRQDPIAQRLQSIPGIGPLTATALVAAVGDGRQFKNGRQMAAWLGLTPKQHSSGGKECLLGMSKRGDAYLRTLFIHGARAIFRLVKDKTDARSVWLKALASRRHPNVAAVAMASKNARIAWAVITRGERYQAPQIPEALSGKPQWATGTGG